MTGRWKTMGSDAGRKRLVVGDARRSQWVYTTAGWTPAVGNSSEASGRGLIWVRDFSRSHLKPAGRARCTACLPFSKQVFRGPRVHFRVDIPRATSHEHRMTATAPLIPEKCGSGKRRSRGGREKTDIIRGTMTPVRRNRKLARAGGRTLCLSTPIRPIPITNHAPAPLQLSPDHTRTVRPNSRCPFFLGKIR